MSVLLMIAGSFGGIAAMLLLYNAKRRLNLALSLASTVTGLWLWLASVAGRTPDAWLEDELLCVGVTAIPVVLWNVALRIMSSQRAEGVVRRRLVAVWGILGSLLLWGAHAKDVELGRIVFLSWLGVTTASLTVLSVFQLRRLTGDARLQMQFWTVGQGAVLLVVTAQSMMLQFEERMDSLAVTAALPLLIVFGGVVYILTASRVFAVNQIVLLVGRTILAFVILLAGCFGVYKGLEALLPPILSLGVTIFFVMAALPYLCRGWNRWQQRYPMQAALNRAFDVTMNSETTHELCQHFREIVKRLVGSDEVIIEWWLRKKHEASVFHIGECAIGLRFLRDWRWLTMERLDRSRLSEGLPCERSAMEREKIRGLLLTDGAAITVLIAVKGSINRQPLTFPEVQQLMDLSEMLESALERVYFRSRIENTARATTIGQLGVALASEIRNPLVAIKAFLHAIQNRRSDPETWGRVLPMVQEEVARIERLKNQLLNLAEAPVLRREEVPLGKMFTDAFAITQLLNRDPKVEMYVQVDPRASTAYVDRNVLKQVLINLITNALQAVKDRPPPRWIRVGTLLVAGCVEITVEDSGVGIPQEKRAGLFQPFQGEAASGIRLGLAYSRYVLNQLDATIEIDPYRPGNGACFRIRIAVPADEKMTLEGTEAEAGHQA